MGYQKENPGEHYLREAEERVGRLDGNGRNDKHWHQSVLQVAWKLHRLDEIDFDYRQTKSKPFPNSSYHIAKLEKERKHIHHWLDQRGELHSKRAKGAHARN